MAVRRPTLSLYYAFARAYMFEGSFFTIRMMDIALYVYGTERNRRLLPAEMYTPKPLLYICSRSSAEKAAKVTEGSGI